MGCVCSHPERAIPVNSPSRKLVASHVDTPTPQKTSKKSVSESKPLQLEKNSSFAESFAIPSVASRGRGNVENTEGNKSEFPKVVVQSNSSKSSEQKPNFDSFSSIDPKEMQFLSQTIRARSYDGSGQESVPAFNSRSSFTRASKPSIFLSPSFFSEKTMNKIGTTNEGFHLVIPKSTDDVSMASLRFDSQRALLLGEKEKGKETTLGVNSHVLSPRNYLLVVPEQTDNTSYVETQVMTRKDSNDNIMLDLEESSTRDKFGDTTRDQRRGSAFGRLDSMDSSVRPWVNGGGVSKIRKNSSISGKGYRIAVNESSFERDPQKKLTLPKTKQNEDNMFLDPNVIRKPLLPSIGSPKAGLRTLENRNQIGLQLTLHIPTITVESNQPTKAKTDDANSDSTPRSNKTGSASA